MIKEENIRLNLYKWSYNQSKDNQTNIEINYWAFDRKSKPYLIK